MAKPKLAIVIGKSGKFFGPDEADVVNAALHLRRPLLVTGHPGTGKSTLAHAVAHELALGHVLQLLHRCEHLPLKHLLDHLDIVLGASG